MSDEGYFASGGASICLRSEANRRGNFRSKFEYESVFCRFVEYSDVTRITLIYNKNYWKTENDDPSIYVVLPYYRKKHEGWEQSWLQQAWIDTDGFLHVKISEREAWLKSHPEHLRPMIANADDVQKIIRHPLDGLTALRIFTENNTSISFYPTDIACLVLRQTRPNIKFFSASQKTASFMKMTARQGITLRLYPHANELDRFDREPDILRGHPGQADVLPLFQRLQEYPDIVYIDLIYDETYWEIRKEKKYVQTDEYIEISLPFINKYRDAQSSEIANILQHGWIDENGFLNIAVNASDCVEI